jgi:hypothetical protein
MLRIIMLRTILRPRLGHRLTFDIRFLFPDASHFIRFDQRVYGLVTNAVLC